MLIGLCSLLLAAFQGRYSVRYDDDGKVRQLERKEFFTHTDPGFADCQVRVCVYYAGTARCRRISSAPPLAPVSAAFAWQIDEALAQDTYANRFSRPNPLLRPPRPARSFARLNPLCCPSQPARPNPLLFFSFLFGFCTGPRTGSTAR